MATELHAGPVQLSYENGFLRYLKVGETEVIRMIYFALRDHNWGTLPIQIKKESIRQGADDFDIHFQALSIHNGSKIVDWQGQITANSNARIDFQLEFTFLDKFLSNRAGFCLLHPIKKTKGQKFQVIHHNGEMTNGRFPEFISPHQPCFDIQQFSWTTADNIQAELQFEGEVFEMEDQRNWTDASFKTYCTPLSVPYPVQNYKGSNFKQRIRINIQKPIYYVPAQAPKSITHIKIDRKKSFDIPSIGSCWPLDASILPSFPSTLLGPKAIDCLRVDLYASQLASFNWVILMDCCNDLQTGIHLVIHDGEKNILSLLEKLIQSFPKLQIQALSLVNKINPEARFEWSKSILPQIRNLFPEILIGVGTPYYFTQLNRNRPGPSGFDFMFFANSAQVHAFDEASIVENLEGQYETVSSAQQFSKDLPIWVSPTGLHARFSPDGAQPNSQKTLAYAFPADPKQQSAFVGGWTLACFTYLAHTRVNHIDFYELWGPRGLLMDQKPTPAWHALQHLRQHTSSRLIYSQSSNPLKISTLLLKGPRYECLYLINHRPESVSVSIPNSWKDEIEWLFTGNKNQLLHDKQWQKDGDLLKLPAYEVVALKADSFIDSGT